MKNFKKSYFILPILSILILSTSCSKDDDATAGNPPYSCSTCPLVPEALALHDNSAKGIYKGIFIGSTGTIHINIQNGSNIIEASLVIDGITIALTSTATFIEGEPFVAPFTGTFNGMPISMTFQVGASGNNPTIITSDIPGHPNAVFQIFKETSTSLIEAFEGTFKVNNQTGIFNIVLSESIAGWSGVAKNDNSGGTSYHNGTINSSKELIEDGDTIIGKINGDAIQGSFVNGDGQTVTLTGYRTL